MDNEFLLQDRIQKIQQIIKKYGEDNFYMSFSGGKDSTVLSALIDMALPENKIPRVYANTGIEYRLILDFVEREREKPHSWELIILKPKVPIKPMLEKEGYPFKSKFHSKYVYLWWRNKSKTTEEYYKRTSNWHNRMCPKILQYQFEQKLPFEISDKCCDKLKKDPIHEWQVENHKEYAIIGIMTDEGGRRESAHCLAFNGNKLKAFQPLVPVTKEWEDWFIDAYKINICEIYRPPYNFTRTGCKGCPFNIHLQNDLDTLEKYFPEERKQCEIIWKPVYDEYRRINYRLKSDNQMTISDYMNQKEE